MNALEISIIVLTLAAVIALLTWWLVSRKKKDSSAPLPNPETIPLRLQAYERLVILTERIALDNLVNRVLPGDLNAAQYQLILTEQIRQEFEYNISQQLYVDEAVWQALTNYKEQNIFIVNQVRQTLGQDASGHELAMSILTLLQTDPQVSLHAIVLKSLNYAAKKLM